jgi:hypothetical protein
MAARRNGDPSTVTVAQKNGDHRTSAGIGATDGAPHAATRSPTRQPSGRLGSLQGQLIPARLHRTRQSSTFGSTNVGEELRLRNIVLLTLVFALVGDHLEAQEQPEKSTWPLPTVELPASLVRVLRDYERAWSSDDGATLAELFLPDGFVLSNGALPVRGRTTIAAGHTRSGGPLQLVAFAWATGDSVGYIIGGYRYPDTVGPGGKFVLALRKDGAGVWKIAADMDNSSRR